MIVASETRYVPVAPGYLILQDTEELYYYVHKTFYEQSVVIEDRYKDSIDVLQKQIGGNSDFVAVKKFVDYAPRPINIMGYFLALLSEDIEDYEDIIGAMDVIATALNLRNLIKQPASIRQSVSFSVSIQNEYRDMWDLFFMNCYEYDALKDALAGGRTVTSSYSPSPRRKESVQEDYDNEEEEEEEDDPDDFYNDDGSVDMVKYNAYMAKVMAKNKEETEKELAEQSGTTGITATVTESTTSDGGNGMGLIAAARKRRSI